MPLLPNWLQGKIWSRLNWVAEPTMALERGDWSLAESTTMDHAVFSPSPYFWGQSSLMTVLSTGIMVSLLPLMKLRGPWRLRGKLPVFFRRPREGEYLAGAGRRLAGGRWCWTGASGSWTVCRRSRPGAGCWSWTGSRVCRVKANMSWAGAGKFSVGAAAGEY